jgi:hypothetical protein
LQDHVQHRHNVETGIDDEVDGAISVLGHIVVVAIVFLINIVFIGHERLDDDDDYGKLCTSLQSKAAADDDNDNEASPLVVRTGHTTGDRTTKTGTNIIVSRGQIANAVPASQKQSLHFLHLSYRHHLHGEDHHTFGGGQVVGTPVLQMNLSSSSTTKDGTKSKS